MADLLRAIGLSLVVVLAGSDAFGQSGSAGYSTPNPEAGDGSGDAGQGGAVEEPSETDQDDSGVCDVCGRPTRACNFNFLNNLRNPFSTADDPDGPIATDRPSFTPSNAVIPPGRLQIESGYTFTHTLTSQYRTNQHVFPELDVRAGLNTRTELRVLWIGQTYSTQTPRFGGPSTTLSGPSDLEIGLGRLLTTQKRLIPQTKLNIGVLAPTGGGSPFSSGGGAQPLANLIYGWTLTEKLSLGAISGYSTLRRVSPTLRNPADGYQQFSQSAILSYAATDRVTLFGEWWVLYRVNAANNTPDHYMQWGTLYRPTPNTQLDVRAGLGLGDHNPDFFTGAGFSIRF